MTLRYIPAKNERKIKRTNGANIGIIGILLIAGIMFAILMLNNNVANAATQGNAITAANQVKIPNHGNNTLHLGNTTQAQRKEAAKNAKKKAAAAGLTVAAPTLVPGPSGLLIPDYFGITPNYANS